MIPQGQLPLRPELIRAQAQQQEQQQQQRPQMSQPPQFPSAQMRWNSPMNQPRPSPSYPMGMMQQMPPPVQPEYTLEDLRSRTKKSPQPHFVPADLPPHLKSMPLPGPPPGVESTVKYLWKDKVLEFKPKPLFHPDILENIHTKSVGYLCNLGKDVIQELIIRTHALTSQFKQTSDRWSAAEKSDIDTLLMFCRYLLGKLWEIRVYVDRKVNGINQISPDVFIELMSSKAESKIPEYVQTLRDKYKGNQKYLFQISNDFKMVEWLSENTDPRNRENYIKKLNDIALTDDVRQKMKDVNDKNKKE